MSKFENKSNAKSVELKANRMFSIFDILFNRCGVK